MEPLACDPSSLPKYPPSKEIDVKMREDQNKRREAVEGRGRRFDPARQRPKQYEAAFADKAGLDLVASVQMQERKRQSFLASRNQTFNSYVQEPSSNLPSDDPSNLETAKEVGREIFDELRRRGLHSGPLTRGTAWPNTEKRLHDPFIAPRELLHPSAFSASVAARARMAENHRPGPSLYNALASGASRFPGLTDELDPAGIEERLYHSQSNIYSSQYEDRATTTAMNSNKNGYGSSNDQKFHYFGPLMLQPKNADDMHMLRERDHWIQEDARRV